MAGVARTHTCSSKVSVKPELRAPRSEPKKEEQPVTIFGLSPIAIIIIGAIAAIVLLPMLFGPRDAPEKK